MINDLSLNDYLDVLIQSGSNLDLYIVADPSSGQSAGYVPFIFTQTTAIATWSISHNLGYKPDAAVYSSGGLQVDASVLQVDNNNLTISFSSAFAGYARLF